MRIGGNTTVKLQTLSTRKNDIGESVKEWEDVQELVGWLDYQSGDTRYSTYNAKIQETSHIFICDYVELDKTINNENSRLVDEQGKAYNILLIDDPMTMHYQLEVYLKLIGGQ